MPEPMRRSLFCLSMLLVMGLLLGGASFWLKQPSPFWERVLPIPVGEVRLVLIHPKMNARQIAQAFFDQGTLTEPSAKLARWMARFGLDTVDRKSVV